MLRKTRASERRIGRAAGRQGGRSAEAGYTLLELLVVIAILALIVAFATPRVIGYLSESKTRGAEIEISNIQAALDLYKLDVGHYPTADEGLAALVTKPDNTKTWHGPYLTRKDGIIDPWGRPFLYTPPDGDQPYVISSLGADGKPGGSGEDQDVTSQH